MPHEHDHGPPSSDSVSDWLARLKDGDEAVAERLWQRYLGRLIRLASRRLGDLPRAAADSEDVVLSAFHSFLRGAREGRFARLFDRHDLWQVLFMLVERKAIDLRRSERAAKRGGGRARRAFEPQRASSSSSARQGIEHIPDQQPTPQFAAAMREELARRLARLDDQQRRIALGKLEGYTNLQLAQSLGLSLRAVERKLAIIRGRWGEDAP